MWLLNFLSEWAIHLILLAGVLGTIAGFLLGAIPFVSRYRLIIQIVSLLLLSLGLWLEGGLSNEKKWQYKIKDMEVKLAQAEAKAAKVNIQIVDRIVKEREVIRERGQTVKEYITTEVTKYDNSCKIPQAAIIAHDAAASGNLNELQDVKND